MEAWSPIDVRRSPARVLDGLAHDVRGPLHNMRGWTALLESGSLGAEQTAHAFVVIARQIEALAHLADDLERLAERLSGSNGTEDGAVADASPAAEAPCPQGMLGGRSVMIVQPDAAELARVTSALADAGATVYATTSAQQALSNIRKLRPDGMLVALEMRGVDGWTLIRQIRNWTASAGGAVPAVAMASSDDPADARRAEREGFQGYLPTAPSAEALVAAVRRLSASG